MVVDPQDPQGTFQVKCCDTWRGRICCEHHVNVSGMLISVTTEVVLYPAVWRLQPVVSAMHIT